MGVLGLGRQRCKFCGTKSPGHLMARKANLRGTYTYWHPACVAAATTEKKSRRR